MLVKELVAELGLNVDEVAFEKAEGLFHSLHIGLGAVATFAAGAAVTAMAMLAKETGEAGEEVEIHGENKGA